MNRENGTFDSAITSTSSLLARRDRITLNPRHCYPYLCVRKLCMSGVERLKMSYQGRYDEDGVLVEDDGKTVFVIPDRHIHVVRRGIGVQARGFE